MFLPSLHYTHCKHLSYDTTPATHTGPDCLSPFSSPRVANVSKVGDTDTPRTKKCLWQGEFKESFTEEIVFELALEEQVKLRHGEILCTILAGDGSCCRGGQVGGNGVGKGIPDKSHGMCRGLEVEVHEGILTHLTAPEHGDM